MKGTQKELTEKNNFSQDERPVVKSKKDKKIKFQVFLKRLEENIRLKDNQKVYSDKIIKSTICLATGPAGTSKSFSACYTLLKLLFEEKIKKIIFTKPLKESGENLGFLPGDIESKMQPYMESFFYICKELIGEETLSFLLDGGFIECRPLAYMRGISFAHCGMFLDEAQNCMFEQLILYITRLGENSKMVITGDVTQRDIEKKKVVLHEFIDMIGDLPDISIHEFKREDIVRNKILIDITDRYEKWKEAKGV